MREAVAWQERMLALDEQTRAHDEAHAAPLALRVERLHGLARTLLGTGEYERAEACAEASLALIQRIDDEITRRDHHLQRLRKLWHGRTSSRPVR